MLNVHNIGGEFSWIVRKPQRPVKKNYIHLKDWMSWTIQAWSGVDSWRNEENILLEVGGVLQNRPIDFNVKFSKKLKSWSTLKLNNWKLVKAIKKTRSNFEGLNILKRWEVEWLKMVEIWRRRYISKVVKIWGMVEFCPIDSHVKNWGIKSWITQKIKKFEKIRKMSNNVLNESKVLEVERLKKVKNWRSYRVPKNGGRKIP